MTYQVSDYNDIEVYLGIEHVNLITNIIGKGGPFEHFEFKILERLKPLF